MFSYCIERPGNRFWRQFMVVLLSIGLIFGIALAPVPAAQAADPEPEIVKDIWLGSSASLPIRLMDVEGTLFFYARSANRQYELWKSDGTGAGTALVKDIYPGTTGQLDPLVLGAGLDGVLYFTPFHPDYGSALWRSDGTEAGTVLVKDFIPGFQSTRFVLRFTELNGALYFGAADTGHGSELWKTDGTETGTVLVKDINPGSTGGLKSYPLASGGMLYFFADDGVNGEGLWKSDGTETGTTLIRTIDGNPSGLTDCGATIFFEANNAELWQSDGTPGGTVLVKDLDEINPFPVESVGMPGLCVGGTLYFEGTDGVEAHGFELWKSDGTDLGTAMVKDINTSGSSGQGSSYPDDFLNFGGVLYFSADDGSPFSRELWRTDGTEAGTTLVKDIVVGGSGSPEWLTPVGDRFYFKAGGQDLWVSDGTEAGTNQVGDINPTGPAYVSHLAEMSGDLYFQANDGTRGGELWKLALATTDVTPPVISGAVDVSVETDNPGGVVVEFVVTATDNVDPSPTVVCNPASGSVFPLGDTTVNCTATDASGNQATASFSVTVLGVSAPNISLTFNPPWVQTSGGGYQIVTHDPNGATADYVVTVTDDLDPDPTVVCDPLSGALLPVGTTNLGCIATNAAGYETSVGLAMEVILGVSAPNISLTFNPPWVQTSGGGYQIVTHDPNGATADYVVTVTDDLDPDPTVVCDPLSGALLPVGTTNLGCIATNAAGYETSVGLAMEVILGVSAPNISLTFNPPWVQTSGGGYQIVTHDPNGATADYVVTVTDDLDPDPTVVCDPLSGALLPVGTTNLGCIATNAAGYETSVGLAMEVILGVSAPNISLTFNPPWVQTSGGGYQIVTHDPNGATADYVVTVTDDLDPDPTVVCDPLSGALLPVGTTNLGCIATNAAGYETSVGLAMEVILGVDSPTGMIGAGVATLQGLVPTGDPKADSRIEKAIGFLEKSLVEQRWIDDFNLDAKTGGKVFDNGRKAVKELLRNETGGLPAVQSVVDVLGAAYQTLAQQAIDVAITAEGDLRRLTQAIQEMSKAANHMARGEPDKAIGHYKNAWKKAQQAVA